MGRASVSEKGESTRPPRPRSRSRSRNRREIEDEDENENEEDSNRVLAIHDSRLSRIKTERMEGGHKPTGVGRESSRASFMVVTYHLGPFNIER